MKSPQNERPPPVAPKVQEGFRAQSQGVLEDRDGAHFSLGHSVSESEEQVNLLRKGFTHESPKAKTVEWYTPSKIFKALGLMFDMDVASPGKDIVPWVPAKHHLTVEDDGLVIRWSGMVWCNPPYGSAVPAWLRRFVEHGNGVALLFARTDTDWFHSIALKCGIICFIRGRIQFVAADGRNAGGGGCGSMLLACGKESCNAVIGSGLGFCFSPIDGF